jgi:ATP-dependent Lhr-like helicase
MHAELKIRMKHAIDWFHRQNWKPLPYQEEAWSAFLDGKNGLVNAPTGSGKTYSILLPAILQNLDHSATRKGPIIIWITPIRALAREIAQASERALAEMNINWSVGIRTGDTSTADRKSQWSKSPEILITTPESIHVMMATKGYYQYFSNLRGIVADEWHELVGSKRGVLVQLALSRIKSLSPQALIWGISATIGNLEESLEILLGVDASSKSTTVIRSAIVKRIEVESIYPKTLDKFPWSGHLGLKLLHEIIPIIRKSRSTLIFTNTRGQCEIWYQKILDAYPEFAGLMAMHHGSISRELRGWVEDALYEGRLKAVICTSSLDLGVDFRPVEAIIQIGGPKGVARFIQRAGRSGHAPNAVSKIYFVPTNALEFIEASALRSSIDKTIIESRTPYIRSYDVLIQYLMTLASSEGFNEKAIYDEVRSTHCYASLNREEWSRVLNFLQHGGSSLSAYDEYKRLGFADGKYRVVTKRMVQRHKMSIGTIVSDVMMQVKFTSGKRIGKVEEWFIAQFKSGDHFWFAGRSLELVRIKDMTVYVKKSSKRSGSIPSWLGGRMSLSSEMSDVLRDQISRYTQGDVTTPEMKFIVPLLDFQKERSQVPSYGELLIEYFESEEGFHLLLYPFEGRFVHEAIGALIAYRISKLLPISFSIAMNDYGLELLSNKKIDVPSIIVPSLFDVKNLYTDIQSSVNAIEMSRRRFREIARISGLIFEGYPGQKKKDRHLQNSAQLLFDVFREYESDNLLYLQAIDETMTFQFEEARLRKALNRISQQKFILTRPVKATPFAFPIIVDRLREHLTSEKLEDRIDRMKVELEK